MPSITVQIEWDVPDDPNWLNPYNLELALGDYCRNTAFTVTRVNDRRRESDMPGWIQGWRYAVADLKQAFRRKG